MMTKMAVETETFKMIINLKPEEALDLIQTVSWALLLNRNLASSTEVKCVVACNMLSCANNMLENCGSKIKTVISNPSWDHNMEYETNG